MDRRSFVRGTLGGGVAGVLGSLSPTSALAQVSRADWSPTDALAGREPRDVHDLTDEERGHVPVLTLPSRVRSGRSFDLVVQIGVRPHECTPDHHIDWIEVALGERRVLVADLSIDVPFPVLRVPLVVRAAETLTVRGRCNLHGVWRTQRALTPV
jgi:superoxide reductase